MSYASRAAFTKKGNAVGFTSSGEVVHGKYMRASRCWRVLFGEHPSQADARCQSFGSEREAAAYAASQLDEARSTELAWW